VSIADFEGQLARVIVRICSAVDFADLFSGTAPNSPQNGAFAGQQNLGGGGLDSTHTQLDLRAGTQQQTGRDLDLFLQGNGFFVVTEPDGAIRYTRDGAFKFNDGALVTSAQELKVMTRNANGELVAVELKDLQVNPPKATTEVTFTGDLSSDDTDHSIDSVDVFDKLGGKHTLSLKFTKSTDATAGTLPGATVSWKVSVVEGSEEIGTGTVDFVGGVVSSPLQLTLAFKNTEQADVAFNFSGVNGFSLGTTSTLAVQKQDGFASGTIATETFDTNGVLKLTYSNGQMVDGPKLVLAEIRDDGGLKEIGNSLFAYQGSQTVTLREAGEDLQVLSKSLEQSNVELTSQFSELILMQRGYQASSQVLSTANDMLQELFDIRGHR